MWNCSQCHAELQNSAAGIPLKTTHQMSSLWDDTITHQKLDICEKIWTPYVKCLKVTYKYRSICSSSYWNYAGPFGERFMWEATLVIITCRVDLFEFNTFFLFFYSSVASPLALLFCPVCAYNKNKNLFVYTVYKYCITEQQPVCFLHPKLSSLQESWNHIWNTQITVTTNCCYSK